MQFHRRFSHDSDRCASSAPSRLHRALAIAVIALPAVALLQGCSRPEDELLRRQTVCNSEEMHEALFKYTYAAVSMAKDGQLTKEKQGWYLDDRSRRLPEHLRNDWARTTSATLKQIQMFRGDGSYADTVRVVEHAKQLCVDA